MGGLNRRRAVINNTDATEDYVTILAEVQYDTVVAFDNCIRYL